MPTFVIAGTEMWRTVFAPFADSVEKATGGRLKIDMYGAGEIIPVLEMWEACSKGIVDIAWSYGTYWLGKTPVSAFSVGLPYTTTNMQDSTVLYHMGLQNIIREDYAKQNIHLLRSFPNQNTIMWTKFPVQSLADLKGKKIRAGGLEAEVVAAAGMATVFFPVPEIYNALDTGVIDGVICGGIHSGTSLSFQEVTKYIIEPPVVGGASEEILINLDTWNKLPDDLKCILESVCAERAYFRMGYADYEDSVWLAKIKKDYGIRVVTLPTQDVKELSEVAMTIYEKKAAESPAFAKALAIVKDFMKLKALD
jgi:TRAP-type mannitol/chloroaromatic compound transport system substrate-binding protein